MSAASIRSALPVGLLLASLAVAAPAAGLNGHRSDESALVDALEDVSAGRVDAAMRTLEGLLARNPEFRLARSVYADLLLAKSRPLAAFGEAATLAEDGAADLLEEARLRIGRRRAAIGSDAIPAALLALSPSQPRVVVADVSGARLYVFENRGGEGRLVADYYVTIGKNGASKLREGDQRTPVGVYFTTGRIAPDALPDFYGAGAFPVNYPNEWDVRLGRTGYGIWIHGVPSDTYSRAPRASDGCLALANEDLAALWREIDADGTPVVMAAGVEWLSRRDLEARRDAFLARLDEWRRDWESRDVDRYARHYARDFRSGASTRDAWIAHKRRVNAAKRWIEVGLTDLSALGYPGERDVVVVTFEQDYRSSNFHSKSRKRQYWRRGADGEWRIVYEGPVRLRPEHLRGIPYSSRSGVASNRP